PEFLRNLKSVDVVENSSFAFECHVQGIPSPTVSWYKDELNIDNSPDFVITKINGSCCLKIRQVKQHHSARYTCRAINPGGEAASSARMNVLQLTAPKFSQLLKDMQVKSGQRVCLQCRVTGHPLPEVRWFREERQLESSPDFQITAFADVHSLTIPEAFEEDTGVYSVRAVNVAGEAKCQAKLSVKSPPEQPVIKRQVKMLPPEFKTLFTDRAVAEGQPVTFECTITGSPRPKVRLD
ncbi:hypothetical protein LOTGIDRAFT_141582, partial [Lottia gigantea]